MSAPVDVLAIIDAERPLMEAASALTGVDTLAAHDAMRDAVAELLASGPAMLRFLDRHQYLDRNGDVRRFRAALIAAGGAL